MYCAVCTFGWNGQRDHARFGLADLHLEDVRARFKLTVSGVTPRSLPSTMTRRAWRARLHDELAFAGARPPGVRHATAKPPRRSAAR